jgi:limonene-1,2-epoxide hydrolase
MESAELELLNIAVNGNIVLTERVDHFVYDGNEIAARCMGGLRGSWRRISAWRD